jgi:hypothetical protein
MANQTVTGKITVDAADALKNIGEVARGFIALPKEIDIPVDVGGLKESVAQTEKLQVAVAGAGDTFKGVLTGMLASGAGLALMGGIFTGIKSAFGGLVDAFNTADTTLTNLENGFRLAGLAGDELSAAMDDTEKFARKLGVELGQPIDRIKNLSAQAAALGGATGQTNEDLTKLAIGIEAATQGSVKGEAAIKLFTRGIADPENAEALDRITRQFPALGAEIEKAGTAPEKLQAGLKALSGTFTTLENDATDVFARLQILGEQAGEVNRAFSAELFGAVDLSVFANVLGDVSFEDMVAGAKDLGKTLGAGLQSVVVAVRDGVQFFAENGETIRTILTGIAVSAGIAGAVMLGQMLPSIAATTAAWIAEGIAAAAAWIATTGPIALAVAGIVAVGAGVAYLYTQFEEVRAVIDGATDVLAEWLSALASVGELVLTVVVTPFKLAWAVIQPVGESLFSIAKAMLGFGSSAESAGESLGVITTVLDTVKTAIQFVKSGVEGLTAAIDTIAAAATNVVEAVSSWDFGGAWDALVGGAEEAGKAAVGAFNDSLTQDTFEEGLKKAAKGLEKGLEIEAKIKGASDVAELQKSLAETQSKLKPLDLKISSGKATAEEKKKFDELALAAAEASAKIKAAAPEAVTGVRTIADSAGNLVQVFELNNEKVAEFAAKNKEAFGREAQENQQKYSANLTKSAANLEEQRKKLADIKIALDAADASGDAAAADKLRVQFAALNEQIQTNAADLKKGFEDGAAAGLLTAEATDKVGTSLGIAAGEASSVAAAVKAAADAAKEAAFDAAKLGEEYAKAGEAAKKGIAASKQQAAGIQYAAQELAKGKTTLEQFNKEAGTSFKTVEEAASAAAAQRKKHLAEQTAQEREARAINRIGQQNDNEFKRAEAVKAAENALAAEHRRIEQTQKANEDAARREIAAELALNLRLNEIRAEAERRKAEAAEGAARKKLAIQSQFDLSPQEVKAAKEAIAKIIADREAKEAEFAQKKQELIGKAALKEFDETQKAEAEKLKLSAEFARRAAELTENRAALSAEQEGLRLQELLSDRIAAAQRANAVEVAAAVAKNAGVLKAEAELRQAIASNNAELIATTQSAYAEAKRIALQSDPEALAASRKTAETIIKIQEDGAIAVRDFAISQIEDTAEREREVRLLELDRTFAEEQRKARGNQQILFEITRRYLVQKHELETAAIAQLQNVQTLSTAFQKGLLDGIAKARRSGDTEEVRQRIKSNQDKLAALEQGLLSGTIAEQKYAAESQRINAELEAAKREQMGQTFDLAAIGMSSVAAVAKAMRETYQQQTDAATAKYAQALDARKLLADAEAKAAIELERKKQQGIVAEVEAAEAELAAARANRQKNEEEAGAAVSAVYTSVALTSAAALGEMLASGQSAGKAMLAVALDSLDSLVPIITAQIFGITAASPANIATLGTWGAVQFALLTGLFKGLVALARSAAGLRLGGQVKDADGIKIPGVEGEFYKRNEGGEEFVVNRAATLLNLKGLTEINRRNITIEQYVMENIPAGKFTAPIPQMPPPLSGGADASGMSAKIEAMSKEITRLTDELRRSQKRITVNSTANVSGKLRLSRRDLMAVMQREQEARMY